MPTVTARSINVLSQNPAWERERFSKLLDSLSQDTVGEMLSIYQEGLAAAIEKAQIAQNNNDATAIQKLAHRLKPTAEMLGFVSFSRQCAEVEDTKSQDAEAVTAWLQNANAVLASIRDALKFAI